MTTVKRIDAGSEPALVSNLALFELPPSNVGFVKSVMRELLPLSALNQQGPYTFRLFSDNQFTDLSKTWFYLSSSLEKKNAAGEWVPIGITEEDKHVGVVNNYGNSFIKQLKVTINNTECSDSGPLYAYRAYMNNELGQNKEFKTSMAEAACYYPDQRSQATWTNTGLRARADRFQNGKTCQTLVKLDFDLAQQSNLMLSNSDIIFQIYRNTDKFLLLKPPFTKVGENAMSVNEIDYRIRIHDMRLYVKSVEVTQSLSNAISKQLESTPARYPMKKVMVRSIFIGKGLQHLSHNIFQTTIPRRVIVGFVSNNAFSGDWTRSPFEFDPSHLKSICVEANGLTYPNTPYELDIENGNFMHAFVDMFTGLGLDDGNKTIPINAAKWSDGWTFFVIPMQSTLEDTGAAFELIRNGTTTIKVVFNDPVQDEGYQMLVYAEFDHILSVNSDRVLNTDGSV